MPMCAPVSRIFSRKVSEQMVVGFGRMSAKEHVASIVNGRDLDAGVAQQLVGVAARRAPHGIEHTLRPALRIAFRSTVSRRRVR